jgi:uncharacterized membrane protein
VNDPSQSSRTAQAADFRCEIRPNRSLGSQGLVLLLVAVALVELVIGAGFLLFGAWLILPFAGLEAVVVAVALYTVIGHEADCELVEIRDGRLAITKRDGKVESRHEFPTYWARIVMMEHAVSWYGPRLVVRSHGRQIEIGASMNEEQKRKLAQELNKHVGFAYR